MSSGSFLENAVSAALQRYPTLHQRWNLIYHRMTPFGNYGYIHNQTDGRIDILLRAMEDDQAAQFAISESNQNEFSFLPDLQMTLSRYWLLSSYELLRLAKNSELGKANAKLQELHRRFELVRIPIGKFAIAKDDRLKQPLFLERYGDGPDFGPEKYEKRSNFDYYPVTLSSRETGSVGWWVIDVQNKGMAEIMRRELSDEFLDVFDPVVNKIIK